MSDHHQEHKPEDFFWLPKYQLQINKFDCEGFVLDIGAGGEGIIGQLMQEKVIGIDRNRPELEEAGPGGLKIVMDATDLKFLDRSFSAATAFYCLMYIKKAYHQEVFREIFRVLKPGGIFRIWDVSIEKPMAEEKIGFIIPLEITLPHKTIETGYGFSWPDSSQHLEYYCKTAEETGFTIIKKKETQSNIYLEIMRPE